MKLVIIMLTLTTCYSSQPAKATPAFSADSPQKTPLSKAGRYRRTHLQGTTRDADVENRLVAVAGEGEGGKN